MHVGLHVKCFLLSNFNQNWNVSTNFSKGDIRLSQQWLSNRLCGLVVQFLATDPEVPGSIPGPTRFSEKYGIWNGVHSSS
jgi:hypothetical protein